MELFIKIATLLQELTKKQIQQYLLLFLCGVCITAGGMIYWINLKSSELLQEIKKIETLSQKSVKILTDNEHMQTEARRIQELFDQNKDFTIKSFFESFCKDQGLNAEPGWTSRVEESNDRFDEIVLTATFKNQTTDRLVKILIALDKKDIIYIKDLTIKNDVDKKINFDITIATKIMKKGFEQKGL